MTKKLLLTTSLTLITLFSLYHLLNGGEKEKNKNDPPEHINTQGDSSEPQQLENRNIDQDKPEDSITHENTAPSPDEPVTQKASLVNKSNLNRHINERGVESPSDRNTSPTEQFYGKSDISYPDVAATVHTEGMLIQKINRFKTDGYKLKEKNVKKEDSSPSREMTKEKVNELIFYP